VTVPIENFEAVLEAAKSGDDWAAARIYDWVQPSLLRFLRWQEPSTADDLASETWLAMAEGLNRFEGDETAFKGWIFAIARRRVADHRRREGRRKTRPVSDIEPYESSYDLDPAEQVTNRLSAQTAIARMASVLPPDQAEVVMLRVVGGLPVEEVARVLGKRAGTVRVLQHRALRRLAAQVNDIFPLEV
jgi:RNA polymerase sigma-70 factor (ECF subfamily)